MAASQNGLSVCFFRVAGSFHGVFKICNKNGTFERLRLPSRSLWGENEPLLFVSGFKSRRSVPKIAVPETTTRSWCQKKNEIRLPEITERTAGLLCWPFRTLRVLPEMIR